MHRTLWVRRRWCPGRHGASQSPVALPNPYPEPLLHRPWLLCGLDTSYSHLPYRTPPCRFLRLPPTKVSSASVGPGNGLNPGNHSNQAGRNTSCWFCRLSSPWRGVSVPAWPNSSLAAPGPRHRPTKPYDMRYWRGDRAAALLLPTRLFGTHAANASGPGVWQACVMIASPLTPRHPLATINRRWPGCFPSAYLFVLKPLRITPSWPSS